MQTFVRVRAENKNKKCHDKQETVDIPSSSKEYNQIKGLERGKSESKIREKIVVEGGGRLKEACLVLRGYLEQVLQLEESSTTQSHTDGFYKATKPSNL